ncbi:MAG: WD40 repeat domain-containing protein, partial [bacterium]
SGKILRPRFAIPATGSFTSTRKWRISCWPDSMRPVSTLLRWVLLLYVLSFAMCWEKRVEKAGENASPPPTQQQASTQDNATGGGLVGEPPASAPKRAAGRAPFLTELRQLKGIEGRVTDVAFSPDGAWLAAGTSKGVELFEVSTGKLLGSAPLEARAIQFTSDGKDLIAVTMESNLTGFHIPFPPGTGPGPASPAALIPIPQIDDLKQADVSCIAVKPGKPEIAVAIRGTSPAIRFLDTGAWKITAVAHIESLPEDSGFAPQSVAFSPDSEYLVLDGLMLDEAKDYDAYFAVWADGGRRFVQMKKLNGYLGQVFANTLLFYSPREGDFRNQQVVVASHRGRSDGYVALFQFFRLSDFTLMNEFDDTDVYGVYGIPSTVAGKNRIVGVHWDTDYLYIWDTAKAGATEWVSVPVPLLEAIAISPDRKTIATAHKEGIVILWKVRQ